MGFISERKKNMISNKESVYGVPLWMKPNLTIKEAAMYSGIGEQSIRELVASGETGFSFFVGKKCLINRELFDEHIKCLCSGKTTNSARKERAER